MLQSHTVLKSALAGLALFTAAGMATAQDRAGANTEVRRISNILKTKVIIQEDRPAGEIVDVVYSDGGCIDYYVAAYNDRHYAVPFDAVQYRAADRVVFIDVAPAQFERVNFFAANQWPDFYAPTFRDQVYASFNVRAGGRNRTTFRGGANVDVDVRDRERDRDPANRDRTRNDAADRDRPSRSDNADRPDRSDANDRDRNRPNRDGNRPAPGTRDGDRVDPSADRPERTPAPADRPERNADDNAPAPPRAGSGTNPGRDGAEPPRAGSDNNPGRGANPGQGTTPPRPGVNPGSGSGSGSLPAPPVVPK